MEDLQEIKHEIPDFDYGTSSEEFPDFLLSEVETAKQIKKTKKKSKSSMRLTEYFSYKCRECKKIFSDVTSLKIHMKIHVPGRLYHCDQCEQSFKVKKYLARHKSRIHDKKNKFKCEFCDKTFYSNYHLASHTMVHTGDRPFKCEICEKSFNRLDVLRMHTYIHTGEKPYKCSFCDYACRDGATLRKHESRHKGVVPQYGCKICKYRCKPKWRLKEHIAEKHLNVDVKKYKCEDCDAKYKTRSSLNNHVRNIHEKRKVYQCDLCKKFISTRTNLIAHMERHFSERMFKCDREGCGKSFKTKGELTKHRIIHFPREQKPCPDCGKRFSRQSRLERHRLVIHRGRWKNTACDRCDARFYSRSYLNKHTKTVHNDARDTYVCDYCNKAYYNKPGLIIHMKYKHFRKKKHKCGECRKKFYSVTVLKRHKLIEHGIEWVRVKRTEETSIADLPVNMADVKVEAIEVEENDLEEVLKKMGHREDENNDDSKEVAYSNEVLSEDVAKALITKNSKDLRKIPEVVFDQFYIEHIVENTDLDEKPIITEGAENIGSYGQAVVKECLDELLQKVKKKINQNVLAKVRSEFKETRKDILTYNARAGRKIKDIEPKKERVYNVDRPRRVCGVVDYMEFFKEPELSMEIEVPVHYPKDETEKAVNNITSPRKRHIVKRRKSKNEQTKNKINGGLKKFKFNTFQCYGCFKLFETKDKLIEHCKDHFKVDNEKRVTHCPLCDFKVSNKRNGIWKHMKMKHGIVVNYTSSDLQLKEDSSTGEKIFVVKLSEKTDNLELEETTDTLKDIGVTEMEILPSVQHINKQLAVELDRKNRKMKNVGAFKKKLVRKGKEWFIEMEKIDIDRGDTKGLDDFENKKEDLSVDTYLNEMINLNKEAKKEGRKILYPCNMCSKVCTALCGLKLHRRVHNTNAKPFRPKVWKHKMEQTCIEVSKAPEIVDNEKIEENRKAKPKSIPQKRYRCDENLKDFFKNNITGSDIDFDQFLRQYRKICKVNKNDFDVLENNKEFGIKKDTQKETRIKKKIVNKHCIYRRVVMLSSKERQNRIDKINALRAKNSVASLENKLGNI